MVEDNARDAELICHLLMRQLPDCEFTVTGDRDRFIEALAKADLVTVDYSLPSFGGDEALAIVRERAPHVPAIVVSGSVGEEKVAECFRMGAVDFLNKDRLARLPEAVMGAIENRRTKMTLIKAQRTQNIGSLASGIAHDLNNCLSGPMIAVGMVMEDLPPEKQEILKKGQVGLIKAAELVRQIMNYLRGSNGGFQPVDLKRQIERVVEMLRQRLPKNIQIYTTMEDLPFEVAGNATQIFQVILNLVVNAMEAMPGGGSVNVTLNSQPVDHYKPMSALESVTGKFAQICVTDTGMGIAPEIISKIFEPFFTTKPPDKGTGLGLSTVLSIVEAHSGFIDVTSAMGLGTTFTVLLPFAPETHEAPKEKPAGKRETILLVDDELTLLELASRLLEDYYDVLTAENGAEALKVYSDNREKVKVVVSDWSMPVMDGPLMVEKMREINSKVRVICLSGTDSKTTGSMNADITLSKPFMPAQLLAALKQLSAA